MTTTCINCGRDLGSLTILETLEIMKEHGPGKCEKGN